MDNENDKTAQTNGTMTHGFVDFVHRGEAADTGASGVTQSGAAGSGGNAAAKEGGALSNGGETGQYATEIAELLDGEPRIERKINPKIARWPLVSASLGFIAVSLMLLVIGPVTYAVTEWLPQYDWVFVVYYSYIAVGMGAIAVVGAVLYLMGFVSAFRQRSQYLANMAIMLVGNVVGLALVWLTVYDVVEVSREVAAVTMALSVLVPCVGLIVLHQHRKKYVKSVLMWASAKLRASAAVVMAVMLIEAGVAGMFLVEFLQNNF